MRAVYIGKEEPVQIHIHVRVRVHKERHNLTGLTFFGHRKNIILLGEMPESLFVYRFKAYIL